MRFNCEAMDAMDARDTEDTDSRKSSSLSKLRIHVCHHHRNAIED
jgi:hypothetical protein